LLDEVEAEEFANQFLLAPIFFDELAKRLVAVKGREAVKMIFFLEDADNVSKNVLLV
jgi:hypothetical protein